MKEILLSILISGEKSPHVRRFFEICGNMSAAHLSTYSNILTRNELLNKLSLSLKDLSGDCIADLFETVNGKFIHFSNYFEKVYGRLEFMHDEEILAYLANLIKSKTNQHIAVIKENFGDIFWKVRKAVRIYIQRNPDKYRFTKLNNEKYISLNCNKDIDLTIPVYPQEELITQVCFREFKYYYTSEVVENIFHVLDNQNDYSKALKEDELFTIVKKFYEKRDYDNVVFNE